MAAAVTTRRPAGLRKANPYGKRAIEHQRAAVSVVHRPGGLQDKAMLVALTVRRWHIGRTEHLIESRVAAENNAETQMMSVRKRLVQKDSVSELRNLEAELRSTHHWMTLPWDDSGYRVLSAEGYFKYGEKINALIEKYHAAADRFVYDEYDKLKIDAKQRLGKLYKESEYPTKAVLRKLYQAELHPRGFPSSEDFRVDLGGNQAAMLRKQIESELEDQMKAAHRSIWERLSEVLTHAVERLKKYSVDGDGKVNHPFRESLIGNIRELLEIVPILNVQGDPELDRFCARIRADITGYTAEVLRDDEKARTKVIDAADDMLAKMQAFMA